MKNDNLGDWRIHATTTLAQDAPSFYSGESTHKVGTPVYVTSLTEDSKGTVIAFTYPSPVALALSIAINAASKAKKLKDKIAFGNIITPLGRGRAVATSSLPTLFDYFEHCMTDVTFSFQALEVYSNEIIADKLKESYELKRKIETQKVSPQQLQRLATTEEKLGEILPHILKTKSPRGRHVWHQFVELKRIRDITVHLKAHDAYIKGRIDRESLFYQFFHNKMEKYPNFSFEMIEFFAKNELMPRWLEMARQEIAAI